MIKGIDHIGIAVSDLHEAIEAWKNAFNAEFIHEEVIDDQKVRVAVLYVGNLRIELICPTSDESPVAKYLKTKGEGIHHIALQSSSTQRELSDLKSKGVKLIDEYARIGAENTQIGFVHPRSLKSVLVEIVQRDH